MISESFSLAGGTGLAIASSDRAAIEFYREEFAWAERRAAAHGVSLAWRHRAAPLFHPEDGQFNVHKLAARWRYRVTIDAGAVSIEAAGNRWALPMVHHMLVHPSLRLVASRGGRLLLHGAALVHQGQTVVLTGPGGSGKTTTSSMLLAHGDPAWQLHADDYVFLSSSGQTHPYLTRAHVYLDVLQALPSMREKLTPGERGRAGFFGRLRHWSGERLKWPVRVPLQRLWPEREVAQEGRLAAIFLLRRSARGQPAATRMRRVREAAGQLLEMNFGEAQHFLTLLAKANGAAEADRLRREWEANEGAVLGSLIAEAPLYTLDLPQEESSGSALAADIEEVVLSSISEKVAGPE